MNQPQNTVSAADRSPAVSGTPWHLLSGQQVSLAWFLVLGWGFFCLLLPAGKGPPAPFPAAQSGSRDGSLRDNAAPAPSPSEQPSAGGPQRPVFQVDLNRATWVELAQLPGLGPVLAKRIVEYRRQHGNFRRVEHLVRVRGIGPRRLQRLQPFLVVDSAD